MWLKSTECRSRLWGGVRARCWWILVSICGEMLKKDEPDGFDIFYDISIVLESFMSAKKLKVDLVDHETY